MVARTAKILFVLPLILLLLEIAPNASAGFDCKGKNFYCANSTHFLICVNFGTSITTFDDFALPCPEGTECWQDGDSACEPPAITPKAQQISEPPSGPLVYGLTTNTPLNILTTIAPVTGSLFTSESEGTTNGFQKKESIYSEPEPKISTTIPTVFLTSTETSKIFINVESTTHSIVSDTINPNQFQEVTTEAFRSIEKKSTDIKNNIKNSNSVPLNELLQDKGYNDTLVPNILELNNTDVTTNITESVYSQQNDYSQYEETTTSYTTNVPTTKYFTASNAFDTVINNDNNDQRLSLNINSNHSKPHFISTNEQGIIDNLVPTSTINTQIKEDDATETLLSKLEPFENISKPSDVPSFLQTVGRVQTSDSQLTTTNNVWSTETYPNSVAYKDSTTSATFPVTANRKLNTAMNNTSDSDSNYFTTKNNLLAQSETEKTISQSEHYKPTVSELFVDESTRSTASNKTSRNNIISEDRLSISTTDAIDDTVQLASVVTTNQELLNSKTEKLAPNNSYINLQNNTTISQTEEVVAKSFIENNTIDNYFPNINETANKSLTIISTLTTNENLYKVISDLDSLLEITTESSNITQPNTISDDNNLIITTEGYVPKISSASGSNSNSQPALFAIVTDQPGIGMTKHNNKDNDMPKATILFNLKTAISNDSMNAESSFEGNANVFMEQTTDDYFQNLSSSFTATTKNLEPQLVSLLNNDSATTIQTPIINENLYKETSDLYNLMNAATDPYNVDIPTTITPANDFIKKTMTENFKETLIATTQSYEPQISSTPYNDLVTTVSHNAKYSFVPFTETPSLSDKVYLDSNTASISTQSDTLTQNPKTTYPFKSSITKVNVSTNTAVPLISNANNLIVTTTTDNSFNKFTETFVATTNNVETTFPNTIKNDIIYPQTSDLDTVVNSVSESFNVDTSTTVFNAYDYIVTTITDNLKAPVIATTQSYEQQIMSSPKNDSVTTVIHSQKSSLVTASETPSLSDKFYVMSHTASISTQSDMNSQNSKTTFPFKSNTTKSNVSTNTAVPLTSNVNNFLVTTTPDIYFNKLNESAVATTNNAEIKIVISPKSDSVTTVPTPIINENLYKQTSDLYNLMNAATEPYNVDIPTTITPANDFIKTTMTENYKETLIATTQSYEPQISSTPYNDLVTTVSHNAKSSFVPFTETPSLSDKVYLNSNTVRISTQSDTGPQNPKTTYPFKSSSTKTNVSTNTAMPLISNANDLLITSTTDNSVYKLNESFVATTSNIETKTRVFNDNDYIRTTIANNLKTPVIATTQNYEQQISSTLSSDLVTTVPTPIIDDNLFEQISDLDTILNTATKSYNIDIPTTFSEANDFILTTRTDNLKVAVIATTKSYKPQFSSSTNQQSSLAEVLSTPEIYDIIIGKNSTTTASTTFPFKLETEKLNSSLNTVSLLKNASDIIVTTKNYETQIGTSTESGSGTTVSTPYMLDKNNEINAATITFKDNLSVNSDAIEPKGYRPPVTTNKQDTIKRKSSVTDPDTRANISQINKHQIVDNIKSIENVNQNFAKIAGKLNNNNNKGDNFGTTTVNIIEASTSYFNKSQEPKNDTAKNNIFVCTTEGTFIVTSAIDAYYKCLRNSLGTFLRYKLQCKKGFYLDEKSVKCVPNEFNCTSEGRFLDNFNVNDYYICIKQSSGRFVRLKYKCQNTYYLDTTKVQCVIREFHETQLPSPVKKDFKDFKCPSEGRFADMEAENTYYICAKQTAGRFLRFSFKCQEGLLLDKAQVKCVVPLQITKSYSLEKDFSTTSRSDGATVKTTESESNEFVCTEEGKFPYPGDRRRYYECKEKSSGFRRKRKKCDLHKVFHKKKQRCVTSQGNDH